MSLSQAGGNAGRAPDLRAPVLNPFRAPEWPIDRAGQPGLEVDAHKTIFKPSLKWFLDSSITAQIPGQRADVMPCYIPIIGHNGRSRGRAFSKS
jgi:hypothetical protein